MQTHWSGSTHLDRVHERVEAVLEELNAEGAQECSDAERRASRCVSVAVAQCNAIARDATLLLAVVERHVAHLQHTHTPAVTDVTPESGCLTWLRARWYTRSLSLIDLQFFIVNVPPKRECLRNTHKKHQEMKISFNRN